VRIELKNPPPPVNFVEWDGLVKLCFNRKNKTLRSLFTSKKVISDLETSWKTFAALRGSSGETPDVKAMVEEVVGGERFDGKRPAKMDQDDFLALLVAFNAKGLHFT
jgi:18S rRNA (adenine1779-N6/adenine1780-N6)-dimethyltransferase